MGQCVSRRRLRGGGGDEWEGSATSERTGCLAMTKERRSRFYIVRRCVVMLLCWHKYEKHS
ncbi:hypothetical protein QJS04_geneDACA009685 [Acorus gramineus]|uniref:Uncharacterized protein n=1 Tax=Acorus gramineus TaxID=55184 RepID=A0AAV9BBV3_ACOGR|nr:hypothetical protein QJS04_geneDACA009685 [Acorus gramineus]